MATRAKDVTVRKEKKPISSSNPRGQASPKPIDKEKSSPSVIPSGKPKPNYLKPTLTSKPETTTVKFVKKSTAGQNEETGSLLRRRSFDRPPFSSREQRSVSSDPKERAISRVKTMPLNSTSLSHHKPMPVSAKPVPASKSTKPVMKSQPSGAASRPIKRSLSSSRKNGTSSAPASSSTSPTNSDHEATQSFDPVTKQLEEDTPIHNETEEVQLPLDVSEMDNKEHVDSVDTQVNNGEEEKLENSGVPDALEGQTPPKDMPAEEAQSELVPKSEEGKVENQPEGEVNQGKEERSNDHPEESSPGEADQGKEKENRMDESNPVSGEKPFEEEKNQEEKEKPDDHEAVTGEVLPSNEGGQEVVEEAKEAVPTTPSGAALLVQKRQGPQGKKGSPSAAYNDVIEETKNKLLEKRKNKVLALVGAFETVIDCESGSK